VQLGTRWPVGGTIPARLPPVIAAAVRSVEEELDALDVDASIWRWTLTYLEGRPVVELDDGTLIVYSREQDQATVTQGELFQPDSSDGEAEATA
jgi:hypothetical protein